MRLALLGDIAGIMTGLQLRPNAHGDTLYLQANHFNAEGLLDPRVQPSVLLEPNQSKHLLLPGDVLLVSKGREHFATRYLESMGRAVASPIFLVIRLHSYREVTPQYLTWFLNHPRTQEQLIPLVGQATVPSLTRQSMLEFEIAIPSLARQNAILQVDALRRRETVLRNDLQALREAHVQKLLYQSLR